MALAEGMAKALETERWARASLRRGGRPAAAPGKEDDDEDEDEDDGEDKDDVDDEDGSIYTIGID